MFYFFLGLIILGFISRILLKFWLKRVFKRVNENAANSYQNSNNANQPSKKKIIDRNEGDYVDYEEVK
jgi:cell division protein FtsI/penicillin-binding protein 2